MPSKGTFKGAHICYNTTILSFPRKSEEYDEENGKYDQKFYAQKLWDGSFESEEKLKRYYVALGPLYSIAMLLNIFRLKLDILFLVILLFLQLIRNNFGK